MRPLIIVTIVASTGCLAIAPEMGAQEKPAPARPQSPVVQSEPVLTGTADVGYRWAAGVGGDLNTYRSVVNLGSGPKLFGLDWTLKDPSHRLFDSAQFRASSWGGDPYNTAQVEVRRERAYRLLVDYRKIAYFNFLPSFANPGRERGSLLDERSFDTFRRTGEVRLTLWPSRRVSSYVAYMRNSGAGTGITTLFGGSNEFPVGTHLRDHSDVYRAGVQMEFHHLHLTLEQSRSTFRNDQRVFNSEANAGNVRSPFQPFLAELFQAYGVRGDGLFTRALFTSSPVSWISLVGQFSYSLPHTSVNYSQTGRTFFLFGGTPFSTIEQVMISSDARLPRSSGNFGLEVRPGSHVRITESWLTDRLHDASAALLTQRFLFPVPVTGLPAALADRLAWNYNQQEFNLLFDLGRNLTVRGGHRYIWGTAMVRAARTRPDGPFETGDLRRHVALGGLNFHSGQRFSVNLDAEVSAGQRSFFRTDLEDYDRASIRARFQASPSLVLAANFFVLRNTNPAPGSDYRLLSRQNSISATWNPRGGPRLSVTADYSRYTLRSRLNYIVPAQLVPEVSSYRDNAHVGTSVVNFPLPAAPNLRPSLAAGGSFFVSSGSRPARYYQPLGRLTLPFGKHLEWNAEWRWYALSQPSFLFEGFRAHQVVMAARWTM